MPEALSLPWIIGIFIAFTGSSHAATPVQVTAADAGRQIVLRTGQKLVVQLESNRSTGYSWSLAEPKSQILVSAGKPSYKQPSKGRPGAGGLETWTFMATKAGHEQLKLEYRRPWEKNLAPAKTIQFNVWVK
jgi:inhibitor of cysteine peptidase